jgi:hypothetical protein
MALQTPVRSVHDCVAIVGEMVAEGWSADARPISKSHAYAYSAPPDNAALLFHIAVEKLDTVRQGHHREYFETGTAGGVVDQPAGDRRRLRAHDDLALACRRTWPNPLI